MPNRISTTQIADSSLYSITGAFSRFDAAQRQINTGKQVQKPSDDPAGTAQSLSFRQRISEIDQYGRTLDQAKGFLSTAESALDSVSALMRQARTIAVQGAGDNISSEARGALTGQLQNILNQMGNIGNASYGTRFLFGGQRTTTAPFTGSGSGYVYNGGSQATGDGDITLDIGRSEPLVVNVTGDRLFTPVFDALTKLRDDIAHGATDIVSREDIAALDQQINNVLSARADMGSKINRIELTRQRNEQTKVNFTKFIADIEDADMPKAIIEFQTAQTAYQAAIQSAARALQSSLLDFLK